MISTIQIMRRLAINGVIVGDISFDMSSGRIEIHGRARDHLPALMGLSGDTASLSVEDIVAAAQTFFYASDVDTIELPLEGAKDAA